MEQMHEIVLSKNRLRDGAMVGRAMRAVKTLKKLDLSDNEMSDLRQGFHFKRHFRDWAILGCILFLLFLNCSAWPCLGPA